MIAWSRNILFNSRVTTIHTSSYSCMVSTAKEGFFKKHSTRVYEMPKGQMDPRQTVAEFSYIPSLRTNLRLQMHDLICKILDDLGESTPIGDAINTCSDFMKRQGFVSEVVNLAARQ